jgi:DNA polymerase III subunit delta
MTSMDALAFLAPSAAKIGPLYVLHGDEIFLKRQVLLTLRQRALGDVGDDQAVSTYAGDKATFAEVFDELETVPFFYPRRLVLVENADAFVTKWRGELEKKIAHLPTTGTLMLDVKTWQATTKLAKLVDGSATIVCKALPTQRLAQWCGEWCVARYGKQIPAQAAVLLVDLIGTEMGQLDQELLKLSIYIGDKARIETADVDRLVGNSRAEDIWKMFDALAAGNAPQALAILQRLFEQGAEPFLILGAFGKQLRQMAQAARLTSHGLSLAAALEAVGVHSFGSRRCEQIMRHLGRRRLEQLYDWLLQMNMDLRGDSMLPVRTLFERFVLKLAQKNEVNRA